MRNVIVDTSPIQYLYQISLLDLLPRLYSRAIIPQSVVEELAVGNSLGIRLPNVANLNWADIREAQAKNILPMVTELGAGEREAIALALELKESLLVLDDALARQYAKLLELPFTGTLGVLLKAKQSGYIENIAPILKQLEAHKFRLDAATRTAVLKLAGEQL